MYECCVCGYFDEPPHFEAHQEGNAECPECGSEQIIRVEDESLVNIRRY